MVQKLKQICQSFYNSLRIAKNQGSKSTTFTCKQSIRALRNDKKKKLGGFINELI